MTDNNPRSINRRSWLKAVGAGTIAGLAGCSGDGGNGNGNGNGNGTGNGNGNVGSPNSGDWPDLTGQEVHFVTDEGSEAAQTFWDNVGAGFESATGASVNTEYVSTGTSGYERISQLLQAGDPPEIYTSNQLNAQTLYSEGVLAPVTSAFEDFTSRMGDPREEGLAEHDGDQYLVPYGIVQMCLYYRRDLSDIVPDTWDKAIEYAQDVEENTDLRGIYIPAGTGDHMSNQVMASQYCQDASVCTWEDDQIAVTYDEGSDREAMVNTLTFLDDLHEYSPNSADSGYSSMYNSLATGQTGATFYPGFRPPWAAVQEEADFSTEIDVVPGMPQPEGGSNLTATTVEGLVTFDGADNEAANAFADFLFQEEYVLDLYFDLAKIQITPAFPEFITSDTYQNALDEQLSDAWPRDTVDKYQQEVEWKTRAGDTDPLNPIPGPSYISPPLSNLQQDVLLSDMAPEDAIDNRADEHQSTINEAQ